jgi:gluconate kinase
VGQDFPLAASSSHRGALEIYAAGGLAGLSFGGDIYPSRQPLKLEAARRTRRVDPSFGFAQVDKTGTANSLAMENFALERKTVYDPRTPNSELRTPISELRSLMSELLVRDRWYALIVAGPSGSGKSVVAEHIGRELSLPVIDADDYHSRAAVDRMKSGTALTDEYRENWAERIIGGMVAWLEVSPEVLKSRLQAREAQHTHFFPASLLGSQLDTAEPPDPQQEPGVIRVPVTTEPPELVARRVWEAAPALHPFVDRPAEG